MIGKKNEQEGFIHMVVLFVVFCVIVWYFKIDIRGFVESHPQVKSFFIEIVDFVKKLWSDYLYRAGAFIWNTIFAMLKNAGSLMPGK